MKNYLKNFLRNFQIESKRKKFNILRRKFMIYKSCYNSPVGKILLASKNSKLIGLWIEGQKYFLGNLKEEVSKKDDEIILVKTKKWLDRYFNGEKPEISELDLEPI